MGRGRNKSQYAAVNRTGLTSIILFDSRRMLLCFIYDRRGMDLYALWQCCSTPDPTCGQASRAPIPLDISSRRRMRHISMVQHMTPVHARPAAGDRIAFVRVSIGPTAQLHNLRRSCAVGLGRVVSGSLLSSVAPLGC